MSKELVTKSFRQQAVTFPDRVDEVLALIETPEQAQELLGKYEGYQKYAKQLKAAIEIERPIALGVLKIKAKLGELMPAKPPEESGARGGKGLPPDGKPLGLSKNTLTAYRKLAEHADELDDYYEEIEEVPTQTDFLKHVAPTHVAHNSGENEWYTPPEYIEAARYVMGSIDLDPATSEIAQEQLQAEAYYTADDDGLVQDWRGNVWLNPPYSKDLIGAFIEKLCDEHEADNVPQAVVLVNNATDAAWFHLLASHASAVCFPKGRVRFLDQDGKPGAPLQGQAVLYLGKAWADFCKRFKEFGFVAKLK